MHHYRVLQHRAHLVLVFEVSYCCTHVGHMYICMYTVTRASHFTVYTQRQFGWGRRHDSTNIGKSIRRPSFWIYELPICESPSFLSATNRFFSSGTGAGQFLVRFHGMFHLHLARAAFFDIAQGVLAAGTLGYCLQAVQMALATNRQHAFFGPATAAVLLIWLIVFFVNRAWGFLS